MATVAALLVLSGVTAPTALADTGGWPPGLEYSGGGTGQNTDNPPAPPPGGQIGTGGSDTRGPQQGFWYYDSRPFTAPDFSAYTVFGQLTCRVKADGRQPLGWSESILVYAITSSGINPVLDASGHRIGGASCNYAPASVVSYRTITCPVRVSGAITGPTGPGATGSATIAAIDRLSAWAAGGRTGTACSESLYGAVAGTTLQPGWWALDFTYTAQTCRVRTYGGTQPDQVVSCGPEVSFPMAKSLTVHCSLPGGWSSGQVSVGPDGKSLNFATNPDSCRNSGPLGWTCKANGPVTYDGLVSRVEVLDDGKERLARWQGVTVGGVRNLSDVMTHVQASGTPLRPGVGLNAPTQPVVVARTQKGTPIGLDVWMTGDVRALWVGYEQASYPDKPSTLSRTLTFSGDFPTTQVVINGINYTTGVVTTSTQIQYVTGRGTCADLRLFADVVRARTSN